MMECRASARKEWELVCPEIAEEGAPGLFKVHPDGLHPPCAHCPPSPSDFSTRLLRWTVKCHDASLACSCLFGAISPRSSPCGGPPRRVIIPAPPPSGTALVPFSLRLYTHRLHPSSAPVLGCLPILRGLSDLILRCLLHIFTSPFPTGWKLLRVECV